MTTVTGLTADRMLAIEAASVVSGTVDANGNLILTTKGGNQINAGKVTGPAGPQGPVGSYLSVLSAASILDVGMSNQIRAGRQLSPADFGNIGLNPPLGLWNLSDLTDASGYGRNLINKGAIGFISGINGSPNTAVQFTGSAAQALYISDTGANDPFRIKTGSFGAWFKSSKRQIQQAIMSKLGGSGSYTWELFIQPSVDCGVSAQISTTGSDILIANSFIDVCDNRWHFAVAVADGNTLRLYVDGLLATITLVSAPIFNAAVPLNIGGRQGDASTATSTPLFGNVDEAFITADVLTEDQIRNLYCAKISHTLGVIPARFSLNVRRRRKGAALAASDFPTQPLRLHNFSAGSLGDEGSDNQVLTNNGGAVAVAGADGSSGNAFNFNGTNQYLSASDASLAGLMTRSYGCWFKTTKLATVVMMMWGTVGSTAHVEVYCNNVGTLIGAVGGDATPISGPYVADGQWHFVVLVDDTNAADGVKRKMYLDGRLVGSSQNMGNPPIASGAAGLRIGMEGPSSWYFSGQIDSSFICNYALTSSQINSLYAKGSQALTSSPKNSGDHIEAMDAVSILATFDTLDSQHQIDLGVAA